MRRTVDLDPDVNRAVRQKAAEEGSTLSQAVNDAVRSGLSDDAVPTPASKPPS